MKKLIVLLTVLFFVSCRYEAKKMLYVCTCQQKKKVAEFVENNVLNSNNMSDKDKENELNVLYRVGVKSICQRKFIIATYNRLQLHSIEAISTKLDSCEFIMEGIN